MSKIVIGFVSLVLLVAVVANQVRIPYKSGEFSIVFIAQGFNWTYLSFRTSQLIAVYAYREPEGMTCMWIVRNCENSDEEQKFKDCKSHLLDKYPELSKLNTCGTSWIKDDEDGTRIGIFNCYLELCSDESNGDKCSSTEYKTLSRKLFKDEKRSCRKKVLWANWQAYFGYIYGGYISQSEFVSWN